MLKIVLQIVIFMMLALPGFADDWTADRLRGTAEQMVRGQWVPLVRGAVVLDGHKVRTGPDGRVDLLRGTEVVKLGPDTQIELREGAGKMTGVKLSSGVITADVERRNVQHFSIQTPNMAAVVKGTVFTVSFDGRSTRVDVDRGIVQVQDTLNDLVVDLARGQQATVSQEAPLEVSGPGAVAVFTFEGQRVVNGTTDVPANEQGRPAEPPGATSEPTVTEARNVNSGNGNGGRNGNGNSGQGDGNGGGNGNGNGNSGQGNGNGGGNGNGNSGQGNGNGGGNGNGNSGNGNGNGGGHGNGNSGQGDDGGNSGRGNGNGNGNGGGRGNGNN